MSNRTGQRRKADSNIVYRLGPGAFYGLPIRLSVQFLTNGGVPAEQ